LPPSAASGSDQWETVCAFEGRWRIPINGFTAIETHANGDALDVLPVLHVEISTGMNVPRLSGSGGMPSAMM